MGFLTELKEPYYKEIIIITIHPLPFIIIIEFFEYKELFVWIWRKFWVGFCSSKGKLNGSNYPMKDYSNKSDTPFHLVVNLC